MRTRCLEGRFVVFWFKKWVCSLSENSPSRVQIRFLLVQKGDCNLSENSLSSEQIRFLLVSKRGLFFKRELAV